MLVIDVDEARSDVDMIYICVRKTTDWDDRATFLSQLSEDFRPKVEVWDATFTMPFHRFRSRIKEIAQLNLSEVRGARLAELDDVPDGSVVVPIDDDDWLAPELVTVLENELEGNVTGYHWEKDILELPPRMVNKAARFVLYTLLRRPRVIWTCSTNSYALVKRDAMRHPLMSHVAASAYFDGQPNEVKRIGRHLSMMNRSLASQTSMGWRKPGVTRSELTAKFHRYRKLYAEFEHPEMAWTGRYVKMMADLMAELHVR